jgi:hypothetical protein
MFCIFVGDNLNDFWSNKIGDVFLEITISKLRMEPSQVDLNYYPQIYERPKFFEFDQNKNLIIKKEVVTINEMVTQDEFGEDVITQEEIKTLETEKIIEPVVYFAKGLMVKPC